MPPRLRQLSLVLLGCLLTGLPPVRAAETPAPTPLAITAEAPLIIDTATGEAVFRGNARLTTGIWTLTADEIRLNSKSNEAHARGAVVITRPGLRVLADRAIAFGARREIEAFGIRLGRPPVHIAGRHAVGTAETLVMDDVELIYGEPDALAPRATAKALTLHKDDRMEASGLRLAVGNFPVVALAGFARPLETPRIIWETRVGLDSRLGFHAGAGAYLPLLPGISPGGSLDIFSKRGVLVGPGARYGGNDASGSLRGLIDVAYIRDQGNTENDVRGLPIDRDRAFGQWQHAQQFGDHVSLNGEVNLWSDSDVLRDFRDDLFARTQEPDNFVELAYRGSHIIASAFTRFRGNDFQLIPERLPELRLDLLPVPVGVSRILLEGQASAAALREKPLDGGPETRTNRLDAYTAVSRTFVPINGVTITPVAGGRVTHYTRAEDGRDNFTRGLGEIGFDARLRASRVRELARPLWGIDRIRHVVEPYLSYRYVPEADRGRAHIPAIDEPVFLTRLQPLGLGDRRDIDDLGEIDTLRLGLKNLIETRREDYGSRRLLHVDLAIDHHFSDDRAGDRFSTLQSEAALTPVDWLEAWVFARTSVETLAVRELNTRLVLRDARAWSLAFDASFLQRDIEQYALGGRYTLNEANELYGRVRYDARASRFNEIQVGLQRRVSQNWIVRIGAIARDGQRRESDLGLKLEARFLAF